MLTSVVRIDGVWGALLCLAATLLVVPVQMFVLEGWDCAVDFNSENDYMTGG